MKPLVKYYFILAPFTSYFALSSWFRLPVIYVSILLLIWLLIKASGKNSRLKSRYYIEDLLLIIFAFSIIVSFVVNFYGTRAINHLLAWYFIIFIQYFFIKTIINDYNIESTAVLGYIKTSSFIVCSIVVIDWILSNYAGIFIRSFFVNVPESANMEYFMNYGVYATGGVAEEPGAMALLLNAYVPLGMLYLKKERKRFKFYLLFVLYIASLIFIGSKAGIFFFVSAFVVYSLISILVRKRLNLKFLFVFVFVIVALLILFQKLDFGNIYSNLIDKIFLSADNTSANIRISTWRLAVQDWLSHPIFGNGPGYGKQTVTYGYLSFYLTILAEFGSLALLFFIIFLILIFFRLLYVENEARIFIFLSLFTVTFHLFILADFHNGVIWVPFIIIQLLTCGNLRIHLRT
jgi:O-antigen ligase